MATIRAFKGVRPRADIADKIAALPYDVMNSMEAREMTKNNPLSFLYIDRPEINLPVGTDMYSDEVYAKAREVYDNMKQRGEFIQDEKPCLYLYEQTMNGRSQLGLVACCLIDDYLNNVIKKHELTREEKERDRIRHVDALNANTGPIFLTYRDKDAGSATALMHKWAENNKPIYDFVSEDDITHRFWVVDCPETIEILTKCFAQTPSLYIADGHHRNASGVKVGLMRREQNPGFDKSEEFNYYLSVIFPDNELLIMDYNRVVKDLNGNSKEEFLQKVSEKFDVVEMGDMHKPEVAHTFSMYLDKKWYKLTAKPAIINDNDPVERLDVSIMQNFLLNPILGIEDPRIDKRIDFVGGLRGLKELERRVDNGEMAVAFAMYPTSIEELMDIADANELMPPKSTWFEPKLRSGVIIHELL